CRAASASSAYSSELPGHEMRAADSGGTLAGSCVDPRLGGGTLGAPRADGSRAGGNPFVTAPDGPLVLSGTLSITAEAVAPASRRTAVMAAPLLGTGVRLLSGGGGSVRNVGGGSDPRRSLDDAGAPHSSRGSPMIGGIGGTVTRTLLSESPPSAST